MKITAARVIVCSPGRNFVTLKIETDQGLTGLGDASLNGRELAVASYLNDHVIPMLIGRDAHQIEDIWQFFYRGSYWRGGPVAMTALAAVDMALWDIKGKVAGLPVYQLLGGACRTGVTVYGHAAWGHLYSYSSGAPNFNPGSLVIKSDNAFIPASVQAQMVALKLTTITVGTWNGDFNEHNMGADNVRTFRRIMAGLEGTQRMLDAQRLEVPRRVAQVRALLADVADQQVGDRHARVRRLGLVADQHDAVGRRVLADRLRGDHAGRAGAQDHMLHVRGRGGCASPA